MTTGFHRYINRNFSFSPKNVFLSMIVWTLWPGTGHKMKIRQFFTSRTLLWHSFLCSWIHPAVHSIFCRSVRSGQGKVSFYQNQRSPVRFQRNAWCSWLHPKIKRPPSPVLEDPMDVYDMDDFEIQPSIFLPFRLALYPNAKVLKRRSKTLRKSV